MPEQSVGAEIGAKFKTSSVQASVSVYSRAIDNMIDYVYNSSDSLFHAANLAAMNVSGAEASLAFAPRSIWGVSCLVSSASISYSYNFAEKSSTDLLTRYSMDFMKHKLTLGLAHDIAWGVTGSWNFSVMQRNGAFDEAVEKVLTGNKKN